MENVVCMYNDFAAVVAHIVHFACVQVLGPLQRTGAQDHETRTR